MSVKKSRPRLAAEMSRSRVSIRIFSAFVLQEAVRLAERTLHSSDATEDALIM